MATNYKNFTPGLTSNKLPNTPEQKLEFFNSIDLTLSDPNDVSKITFAYESGYSAAYFAITDSVSFTTLGEKVEFMVSEGHAANQTVTYSSHTALGPSYIGTFSLSASNRYYVKKIKITTDVNVYKTYVQNGDYGLGDLMTVTTKSSPSTSRTIYDVSTETAFPLIKQYTIPLYRVGNEGIRSGGWKKEKYSDDWPAYNWFEIGSAPDAGGMNYQFSDNNAVKKRRRDGNFCKEFPRFLYDNLGANEFVPISFVMTSKDNVKCYFTKTYWPTSSIPSVGTGFAPNSADIQGSLTSGIEKTLYLAITEPVASSVSGNARGGFTRGAEGSSGSYISYEGFPSVSDKGKAWANLNWAQPEMTVSSTGGSIYYINFTDLLKSLYDTYCKSGDYGICIYMQRSSITVYRLGFRSPYVEGIKIAYSGSTYNGSSVFGQTHLTNDLFDDMFGRANFDWGSSVGWTGIGDTGKYKIGTLSNSTYYNECVFGKSMYKMIVDFNSIPYAIDNPTACTLQLSRCNRGANPAKESKSSPHHGGMCTEVVWMIGMPFYMQKTAFKSTGNSPYEYNGAPTGNSASGSSKTGSTDTLTEYSYTTGVPQNISEFSNERRFTGDYRHRRENSGHVLVQHIAHLIGLYRTTDVGGYKALEWTYTDGGSTPANPLTFETKAPGLAILYMTDSTSNTSRRYYHTNQSIILYRNKDGDNYQNSGKYSDGTGAWSIKYQINGGTVNTLYKGNSFGLTSGQTVTFTFKSGSQRTYSYNDLVNAPDNRPGISGN